MIGTGVLLWANRWVMAAMPKLVLDIAGVVHYYEAVLAALAILIWHIYYVMLDPDVYPMDPAWLTGISTRIRRKRSHDAIQKHKDEFSDVPDFASLLASVGS